MNQPFLWSRAWSIAVKEYRHITRDPITLVWALGLPLILVLFFGYAIDFNVREVRLATADRDFSRASRELMQVFSGSGYFVLQPMAAGLDPQTMLDQEKAKGVMVIEPGFGKDLAAGRSTKIQVLLDGADNSTAGTIGSYLAGIQQAARARLTGARTGNAASSGGQVVTRYLFNSELNSRWFIVPGLIAMVMGVLSVILTSLTVAREWEMGSMELLLSTPVKPLEIILGKIAPYLVLVVLAVAMIYAMARLQFGLPFRGSHLLFLAGVFLFLTLCLAQGLLISVVTRQQALAVQLAFISGLLPTMLLSGFIFPIESMPVFFQYFTLILPPRWFVQLSRILFLKGSPLLELATPLTSLLALNLLMVVAALRAFKKDVEP